MNAVTTGFLGDGGNVGAGRLFNQLVAYGSDPSAWRSLLLIKFAQRNQIPRRLSRVRFSTQEQRRKRAEPMERQRPGPTWLLNRRRMDRERAGENQCTMSGKLAGVPHTVGAKREPPRIEAYLMAPCVFLVAARQHQGNVRSIMVVCLLAIPRGIPVDGNHPAIQGDPPV